MTLSGGKGEGEEGEGGRARDNAIVEANPLWIKECDFFFFIAPLSPSSALCDFNNRIVIVVELLVSFFFLG